MRSTQISGLHAVQYRKNETSEWLYARPASRDTETATYKKDVFWTSGTSTRAYCWLTKESADRFAVDVLAKAKEVWGEGAEVQVISKEQQMLR